MFRRHKRGTSTGGGRPEDPATAEATIPPVDFLIVGAMKCGTTTLRRVLAAHPEIHMPERELHFFGNHRRYLSAWKGGRLDAARLDELYGQHYVTDKRVLGAKTPNYMVSSLTVERIHRFHPAAKLVVMVRDPVVRAESHWNHLLRQRASGKLPQSAVGASFSEHIDRDEAELARARDPDAEIRHPNILYRGVYDVQIRGLYHFFDPARVHVGLMEDLRDDAGAFFGSLFAFLGVEHDQEAVAAAEQARAAAPEKKERISGDERARLRAFYAETVANLETMLGRDLSAWRS